MRLTKPKYDGDTFTCGAYTFRVKVERADDMAEPWKEHDGHGPVSEWTSRAKRPGERVIAEDRSHKRYYDMREAVKIALRDKWGVKRPGTVGHPDDYKPLDGESKRAYAARAAEADYAHLRAWCRDEWEWLYIDVVLLDEDGRETGERAGVGGVEDPDGSYWPVCAGELAEEIVGRIEVDAPLVQLSEN